MAKTVSAAFSNFRTLSVDLNANSTVKARASRDYLIKQIKNFSYQIPDFPKVSASIPFGSFARRTKIQPLDDIDLIILIAEPKAKIERYLFKSNTYALKITDSSSPLKAFADNNNYVSSIKVINKFVSSLAKIPNYRNAEINRNKQAAVLNLSSYSWSFDIVPALEVYDFWNQKVAAYIIPDGEGQWMKTDPRIDARAVAALNQKHQNLFLPTLRLLKYWNNRTTKPRLDSYYFETLVGKVFQSANQITGFPQAISYFFERCPLHLMSACPDPKNLGRALDSEVARDIRRKIASAMKQASTLSKDALLFERNAQTELAISNWGQIFGSEFPT